MKQLFVLLGGLLFGFGLAASGMTKPEIVLSFLNLDDLGLLFVMGGGVAVSAAAYHLGPRAIRAPLCGSFRPYKSSVGRNTVLGAVVFGLGWGLSGICPGSALASVGIGNYPILIGIAGMFLGAYLQGRFMPES